MSRRVRLPRTVTWGLGLPLAAVYIVVILSRAGLCDVEALRRLDLAAAYAPQLAAPEAQMRAVYLWYFGGALVGSVAHVLVHEIGHLCGAVLMWLPVRLPEVMPGGAHVTQVVVPPDTSGAQRFRMAAYFLSGSLANLGVSAWLWSHYSGPVFGVDPLGEVLRSVAVECAALVGVSFAGLNLLPLNAGRHPGPRLPTDGLSALRWLFRPEDAVSAAWVEATFPP
jgi:hypothetical protein